MLKATAEHLRQRPDLAHVWRNIDNAAEMRHAWRSMQATHRLARQRPASSCSRSPRRACRSRSAGMEDPLFGPVVSFGVSGPATELLGDRAYRIPPMHGGDASDMVREIKAAPLLFGYRGGEQVDVAAVEQLLLRVAQLKNDLPQVRSLELTLVLAGAHGATVLDGVAPGRAGRRRPLRLVRAPAVRPRPGTRSMTEPRPRDMLGGA